MFVTVQLSLLSDNVAHVSLKNLYFDIFARYLKVQSTAVID